jgi:hypothetical protein
LFPPPDCCLLSMEYYLLSTKRGFQRFIKTKRFFLPTRPSVTPTTSIMYLLEVQDHSLLQPSSQIMSIQGIEEFYDNVSIKGRRPLQLCLWGKQQREISKTMTVVYVLSFHLKKTPFFLCYLDEHIGLNRWRTAMTKLNRLMGSGDQNNKM